MIPESKAFLNELDEMIKKNNSSSEDDLEAKKIWNIFRRTSNYLKIN